jgi:hypothetical protein
VHLADEGVDDAPHGGSVAGRFDSVQFASQRAHHRRRPRQSGFKQGPAGRSSV